MQYNNDTYPTISKFWPGTFVTMNDDDGSSTHPPPFNLSALLGQDTTGTETDHPYTVATAPPYIPPNASASTLKVTSSTLVDTATVSCFTFLPSISVQDISSEVCDCGSTTASVTTKGSFTGCAFGDSIYPIIQSPSGTATGTTSNTAASIPTPSPHMPVTTSTTVAPITTPPPRMLLKVLPTKVPGQVN